MSDLGIFSECGEWTMSPEQERAYWDHRLEPHFARRRPTAPLSSVVQVVSYCGAESSSDVPATIAPVPDWIALRIS
jgi:hypothetical protein